MHKQMNRLQCISKTKIVRNISSIFLQCSKQNIYFFSSSQLHIVIFFSTTTLITVFQHHVGFDQLILELVHFSWKTPHSTCPLFILEIYFFEFSSLLMKNDMITHLIYCGYLFSAPNIHNYIWILNRIGRGLDWNFFFVIVPFLFVNECCLCHVIFTLVCLV